MLAAKSRPQTGSSSDQVLQPSLLLGLLEAVAHGYKGNLDGEGASRWWVILILNVVRNPLGSSLLVSSIMSDMIGAGYPLTLRLTLYNFW